MAGLRQRRVRQYGQAHDSDERVRGKLRCCDGKRFADDRHSCADCDVHTYGHRHTNGDGDNNFVHRPNVHAFAYGYGGRKRQRLTVEYHDDDIHDDTDSYALCDSLEYRVSGPEFNLYADTDGKCRRVGVSVKYLHRNANSCFNAVEDRDHHFHGDAGFFAQRNGHADRHDYFYFDGYAYAHPDLYRHTNAIKNPDSYLDIYAKLQSHGNPYRHASVADLYRGDH